MFTGALPQCETKRPAARDEQAGGGDESGRGIDGLSGAVGSACGCSDDSGHDESCAEPIDMGAYSRPKPTKCRPTTRTVHAATYRLCPVAPSIAFPATSAMSSAVTDTR
jgi:hypothetical protein